jgi:hypothetical protein
MLADKPSELLLWGTNRLALSAHLVVQRGEEGIGTLYLVGQPNPRSCEIGELISRLLRGGGLCKTHAIEGVLAALFWIAGHGGYSSVDSFPTETN